MKSTEVNEINAAQDEIIAEISALDEWADLYQYLINLGAKLNLPDQDFKTDDNLVRGCQSKLWLAGELNDGRVVYYADSDAVIIRGILALILRVLNNRRPVEIVDADLYFIEETGLAEHLSPVRSNGLEQALVNVKELAKQLMARDI